MKYPLFSAEESVYLSLNAGPGPLTYTRREYTMQEEKELRRLAMAQYTAQELQEELTRRTWNSTPDNRDLVSLVHGIFCKQPHQDSIDCCLYYDEMNLDTCWEERSHVLWTMETQRLLDRLGLTTCPEFKSIYLPIQDILIKLKALSPAARALFNEIQSV